MKKCSPIPSEKKGVCVGNLIDWIKIFLPDLTAPSDGVDFTKPSTDILECWAMVKTSRGSELFDGSNLGNAYTHIFFIQHMPLTINTTHFIEFKDENYKIVDVENFNEHNEFLALKCIKKGDDTLAASKI